MSSRGRIVHLPRPSRVSAYAAARFGPPVIDPASVHAVLEMYGLLPLRGARNLRLGRRSRNVAVVTQGGKKVVKLYRPQWTPDRVRHGHSILKRLTETEFPTPLLLRGRDGADWVSDGSGIYAVFDFLSGTNYSLHYLLRDDRLYLTATAGTTLAVLHKRLERFVPGGRHHLGFESHEGRRRRDVEWHAAALKDLQLRSDRLSADPDRTLAERLIQRSSEVLDEIARLDQLLVNADFPRLVIHGDYGLHNLIFESSDVAVPIDFELARLDWRVNDLISALGKHRYSGGHYDLQSMETFMRAYALKFPLTADERRLLPDAWRYYKLQAAVQYWNSYFETDGPHRKLESALDSIDQGDVVLSRPDLIARIAEAAPARRVHTAGVSANGSSGPTVMQVTADLQIGGAQETARVLAKYLPQEGCRTLVATFGDGPLRREMEEQGVVVERLPARRHGILAFPIFVAEMLRRRRDLLRLVDRHGVDVIQTQGLGTLDFLVMTLGRHRALQIWWTIQNANFMVRKEHLPGSKWLLGPKRAAHRLLYRVGARIVDGVIAVSNDTKKSFRDEVGAAGYKVEVVCNAVDAELYPAPIERNLVRSRMGIGPRDHLMTMVGTFKRQKGHLFLVEALAAVKEYPNLHVRLVGDGELIDGVRAQVRDAGLESRVLFLGSRRDVPEILAASDSFVLPSLWEGLPVALVEAMASGLPVIATAVSGTSQVMLHGVTGWLVPPGDSGALADAILDLLADPEGAREMGAAGRRRVDSEFSARAQAERLASLFHGAASRSS